MFDVILVTELKQHTSSVVISNQFCVLKSFNHYCFIVIVRRASSITAAYYHLTFHLVMNIDKVTVSFLITPLHVAVNSVVFSEKSL